MFKIQYYIISRRKVAMLCVHNPSSLLYNNTTGAVQTPAGLVKCVDGVVWFQFGECR